MARQKGRMNMVIETQWDNGVGGEVNQVLAKSTPALGETLERQPHGITGADNEEIRSPRVQENIPITQGMEPSYTVQIEVEDLLADTCPQTIQRKEKSRQAQTGPSTGLKNPKRKSDGGLGSSRKRGDKVRKEAQRAEIRMDLDGFYEIHLADSREIEIADEWGMLPEDVRREVQRDNLERKLICTEAPQNQGDDNDESRLREDSELES